MTRDEAIREVTDRLAKFFHPEKIFLFGSAARTDSRADSDLDFLVVLQDDAPEQLLRAKPGEYDLSGLGHSKDVLIWRAHEFDRWLPLRSSLPATVVREGRLLYERVLAAR